MNQLDLWRRYQQYLCVAPGIGLQLDISRMMFDEPYIESMAEPMARALTAMDELERGAKANVDEDRMVGHYWLRAPELAPDAAIRADIEQTIAAIKQFAIEVQNGQIVPERGDGFYVVLVIGIGGSALGPQFVADALSTSDDPVIVRFIDNTDSDGIDRTLAELDEALPQTLTLVFSKSGGTKETHNGMLEVAAAYQRKGLSFAKHAVAVTCEGSTLHKEAVAEGWLRTFPIWDWVGGRTSVLSAVGLLPAALQGIDIDAMLAGARDCDMVTREREVMKNPAALLALMWHYAGGGKGERNMVVLPYRDRLGLLGRYLQQLVMESVGKKRDRSGRVVHQGLTVYGNKGSTDQHAYVQQLREGPNDFFATFISVRRDRDGRSLMVEEDVTTGDYLSAFWQGTRAALYENSRESITAVLDELNARSIGVLIALFERAVGLYAEMIDVNAYHQPGVGAGKKAAGVVLGLQRKVLAHLRKSPEVAMTVDEIAEAIGEREVAENIQHMLDHMVANPDHGITRTAGTNPFDARYGVGESSRG
ncbi:MAG: glucose-6-phosphate isomerase [Phycisphaerae bacterium]